MLLSGVLASNAFAQPEPVDDYFPNRLSGWRFEIEPYGLLPVSINGDVTVGDRQIPFSADLADLLDHLDFALTARFEAWKGQWGIVLNTEHYWVGSETTLPGGMTADHHSRVAVGSALIAHRFGAFDINDTVSVSVDTEAGVWLARLHSNLNISDGFMRSSNRMFPKAMVAARPILRITPAWAVINRAYVTFPDVSWFASLGAEYDWRWLGIELGYYGERIVLSGDFVALAATAHGPYFAVAFRWGAGRAY